MTDLKNQVFDFIHNLVFEYLIKRDGVCDHDVHGEIVMSIIDRLSDDNNNNYK